MSELAAGQAPANAGSAAARFGARFTPHQLLPFLATAGQLLMLVLIVQAYALESAAFFRIMALACGGFVLQFLLPTRLRPWCFVALSVAGIGVVFGITQGAWLLALGLLLIGLCHLPVPFVVRVLLVVAAASGLAALRAGVWPAPWSGSIWPIFGAMFMFRLIVYLYDLRNRSAPFSPWRALAYFFMLPNLCTPLFPVVDYKTFCRSRNDATELATWRSGIDWMFRGITQLMLYRLVYQYLSVDPTRVQSASGALLALIRPYLLYLRISGSFHVAMGMMHVFGFAVPETNHSYFLARSFTDYWRRINIYWKDFLQKIFFNPVYFRLSKRIPPTPSLVLATAVAFFATWALHSYQWFWIRNSFPVIWQDIAFWSVMGLVVLLNMLRESAVGRRRTLSAARRTLRSDLLLALQTVATFLVIAASWAIWSTPSFGDLRLLLSKLARVGPQDALWILLGIVTLGATAVIFDRRERAARPRAGLAAARGTAPAARSAGASWLQSGLRALNPQLLVVGIGLLVAAYGSLVWHYDPSLADVVDRLKNPLRLSSTDAQLLDRGYYEDLTDVTRFNPQLAAMFAEKPPNWDRCWAIHRTGSFPTHELLPDRHVAFKGALLTTNRWGMRDRDYAQPKPAGTYRIALLGDSHAMGTGVADDADFENLVEDRLNAQARAGAARHFEILNFSVGGYGPIARLTVLDSKALAFAPDALLLAGINDLYWVEKELAESVEVGYALPYPELTALMQQAHAVKGAARTELEARLQPVRAQALLWVYGQMAQRCAEQQMRPMAVFFPQPRVESATALAEMRQQIELARAAGFTIIDLLDVYQAAPSLPQLWIAKWDGHPNATGHQMIADRLYPALCAQLGLAAVTPTSAAADAGANSGR